MADKRIQEFFNKISKKEHNDDVVDRLNYATTTQFLGLFAGLILAKQIIGEPLQCFIPAEYPGPWEKYIESYCFVENTYYVNSTLNQFPEYTDRKKKFELKYYQWLPYIFLMEALICYAPKLIFKILYSFTDTQVTDVIEYAWKKNKDLKVKVLEKPKDDGKNDDSNPVTALITERLVFLSNKPKREANVRFEDYLTVIYFLMKILAICSIIFQLILLAFFIDAPDIYWGWDLFIKLMNGQDWRVNGYFPRVTFCDLETRDIGQHRPHTIQCVLMLNMFIEKIYLFLFFWFWTMLVISVANLLWWCWRVLPIGRASRMINDALEQSGTRQPDKRDIELFIRKSLHKDGIVILRLIDSNVGFIAMSDVCRRLWDNFFSKKM